MLYVDAQHACLEARTHQEENFIYLLFYLLFFLVHVVKTRKKLPSPKLNNSHLRVQQKRTILLLLLPLQLL